MKMSRREMFLGGMAAAGSRLLVPAVALSLGIGIPSLALGNQPDPERRGSMLDRLVPSIDPVLTFHNANTGDKGSYRFFNGSTYDMEAINGLNWMFRDWRQNKITQIDVRLFWGLAAVAASAQRDGHSGEILLTSGFRTDKTNDLLRRLGYGAARESFHLKARAVDFSLWGVDLSNVSRLVRWLEVGGTGHYRRSNFTHMDTGPVRSWTM